MLIYVLIGLCLVLTGVAGLQFTYLFYLDRLDRERKKHLHQLERRCARIAERLEIAERRVQEQSEYIAALDADGGLDNERWADVIDDR